MAKSRRVASAQPPASGAARAFGGGMQLGARAQELGRALLDGFRKHDLLTYASAISFQILTAIIPFLLFVIALAGLLNLNSVWRDHIAPQVEANVSPDLFSVISDAVNKAFGGGQLLWATLGAGLALCLQLAPFFSVRNQGVLWDVFAFLARWALAIALLLLAVGLLLRHAPARPHPLPWVSLGAGIVIASWAIVSVAFFFYLTSIASYRSVFGSLAAVIVVMAYLYTSTIVFLFGAQLDAIIRAQATGTLSGAQLDSSERP
jgi:uncharacterized BrkB/YihY/UPF0761 family membrane protein